MALDLTTEQEGWLGKAVGVARFAYPGALAEWKRPYHQGEKPPEARRRRELNAIKGEKFPGMLEVPKSVPQQAIKNLGQAFKGFFEGDAEYPKFKKEFQRDSARLDNGPGTFRCSGKRRGVPVWGELRMREGLRFTGKPLSATVSREADRGFVSIPVEVEIPEPQRENPAAVGVDLGITTPATLSRGEKLEGPKALSSDLKRLPRCSRAHRRKPKGGSHRRKSAKRLARIPRRIRHLRQDWLHKTTTGRVSRFTRMGIEDLKVRGRWANRHLSLAIADRGGHEFRRPWEYKSQLYGWQMVVADRGYPSSQLCSICGYRIEHLSLWDRTWRCPHCGSVHDRDKNAAKNLEKYATVSYTGSDACGELVQSGRSTKQESMSIH
jgi:putative transposase